MKRIEKAHNVGDMHPSKPWMWTEYKPGKFDWRPVKGNKKSEGAPAAPAKKTDDVSSEQQPTQPTSAPAPKKEGTEYNPPKPKVKYSSAPNVKIDIPETWLIKTGDKTTKTANRDKIIALMTDKTDDELIKRVGEGRMHPFNLQIMYDILASRGVDENKIKIPNKLKDFWDREERKQKSLNSMLNAKTADEDEEEEYNPNLMGMDADAFLEEFQNGDMGWADKSDKRVKREFNNLTTLTDRQRYDAFLDYAKRKSPDYMDASRVVKDLNGAYLTFILSDMNPLFLSSGGAGVGKTWGLNKLLENLNYKQLTDADSVEDGDWNYVKCANPKSDKDFFQMLKKYNGKDNQGKPHILIFDDADSIMMGKQYISTLKTIADGDPNSRVFRDPDGTGTIKFTGKIVVITNKTGDDLMDNSENPEDVNAILSRAAKRELKFTVEENLEILKERYKDMDLPGLTLSPSDEAKAREEVYHFIVDNKDKLDPAKFTVRKFREVMTEVQSEFIQASVAKNNAAIKNLINEKKGGEWRKTALKTLNKAEDVILGTADDLFEKAAVVVPESKVEGALKKILANDPKAYKELFGDLKPKEMAKRAVEQAKEDPEGVDIENEETEEEVAKAFCNTLGDMTIEEAESILFDK